MELNRRELIIGSAALTAGATLGLPAWAQLALVGHAQYKVGDITVTAIGDGFAERPLEGFIKNAELADVQKVLQDQGLPTDKLQISFTTLVIQNGDQITLIDTGNGDSGAPTSGKWMENFTAAGFNPTAVNTIVFSHFHGDHVNGFRLKDGTAVFPNAQVLVPEAEWAFWMDDAKMNSAPEGMKGAFANVRRVFQPIAANVTQFQADKEIVPGITAIAAPGHTPGHTVFRLSSGDGNLMVMSDTTNHPALFVKNPDWTAVFDMDGPQAIETRRKLLDQAAADKVRTAFYHAPFPANGTIEKDGNGFTFVPTA